MILTSEAGTHHHVLEDCQFVQRPDNLVGARHPHVGKVIRLCPGHIFITKYDTALFGSIDPIDHIEQGSLACSIRSDQTKDLALRQIKSDSGERLQSTKTFRHSLSRQKDRHTSILLSGGNFCLSQPIRPAGMKRMMSNIRAPAMTS